MNMRATLLELYISTLEYTINVLMFCKYFCQVSYIYYILTTHCLTFVKTNIILLNKVKWWPNGLVTAAVSGQRRARCSVRCLYRWPNALAQQWANACKTGVHSCKEYTLGNRTEHTGHWAALAPACSSLLPESSLCGHFHSAGVRLPVRRCALSSRLACKHANIAFIASGQIGQT